MGPKTFLIKEMKINMQCTYFEKLSNDCWYDCWNWPRFQKMYFWTQCTLEEEKATHKDFVLI